MKKKIMMLAVLLGALTLNACVDNKESASVEAVRNAKAEQLKAVAALRHAEAEAAKLIAEANAALTEAEAEAKKIENDKEKALFAIEMAGQEQKLEAALLNAQIALAAAKTALEEALKTADENTRLRITQLASNYYTAVTDLNALKRTLFGLQTDLVLLENGVVTAEATLAKDIAAQEVIINKNKSQIEVYKQTTTPAELDKAIETSNANLASLNAKSETANLNNSLALNTKTTALDAYSNSKYQQLGASADYSAFFDFGSAETLSVKFYANGTELFESYDKYPYAKVDAVVFEMAVAAKDASAKGLEAPLKTAQDAYAISKEATDKAEKAWREAEEADKASTESAYKSAKSTSDNDLQSVENARKALASAQNEAKKWREDYIYLTNTGVADQNKLVDALNDAEKKAADAAIAISIVNADIATETANNTALNNIKAGADVNQLIADCEKAVSNAQIKINELKATRADKDALVAEMKAEIASAESQILAGEANVKSAKAALDAAMAE